MPGSRFVPPVNALDAHRSSSDAHPILSILPFKSTPPLFKRSLSAILIIGWATGSLWGQGNNVTNAVAALPTLPKSGFEITSVSGFMVYYSNGLPNAASVQPGTANLSADGGFGGSVKFDWTKFSERTTFSLSYTPSYTGRVKYTSLDALNHALSLNISRKLVPRWTLRFSAGANLSTLDESLFAPTPLSTVASFPSTFSDLASALMFSQFTNNPALGVTLTNAPLVQSPMQNLFYGERMFTSTAQATLSYSYSPRLSVTLTGGASRSQSVSGDQSPITTNAFLIPNTTSGTAGVTISYSYSPEWQIGGSAMTNRTSSFLEDVYTTTSLATISRALNRRWIVQLHGGFSFIDPIRETGVTRSTAPLPSAGGGLTFKTLSHTFLGAFDHTASDSYGLGAASTSSTSASWRWRRPGNSWWLQSSVSWQQLRGNAAADTSGWQCSAGFGRVINPQLTFVADYAYLTYTGLFNRSGYSFSQSALRTSLSWSPRGVIQ